jgi:hypothetical protein
MASRLSALTRTVALGVVLLVLAGCLQVKAGLEVNSDDTVSGQLVVFATKSELTLGGQAKEVGFANYRKQLPPLPEGKEAPFEDATNFGVIITYDHTPLAKFNGDIKVVRTGNQVVFTISLDPAVIAAQVPGGNAASIGSNLTLAGFEITVTLPGNIVSAQTNGTVIGQNNVAWNLAPNAAKPKELKAVSVVAGGQSSAPASASASASASAAPAGGGSSHTLLWVVLVVVLALLLAAGGVVGWLLLRRRSGGAAKPGPVPTQPTGDQPPSSVPSPKN